MHDSNSFRPATVKSIILGVLLFVVIAFAFTRLGDLTKWFGEIFLFLPDRLGWVQTVHAEEVIPIAMNLPETEILVPSPGRYAVYTDDYDLLTMSNDLEKSGSRSWFRIHSQNSMDYLEIDYVHRGQSIYDTRQAPGRPVMTLIIHQPGRYVVEHPSRPTSIYLTPDRVTGNEGRLNFFIFLQIAALFSLIFLWVRHRRSRTLAKVREVQQLKKIDPDAFWQEMHKSKDLHKK
jgi:hypothetical protein